MNKQQPPKTLVDKNRLRRLIILGHTNRDIAALLHCSEKTVSRYRSALAGAGVQFDTDWHATVRLLRATGMERETIIYMRIRGASLGRIADLFCMDRQQVFNITKNIVGSGRDAMHRVSTPGRASQPGHVYPRQEIAE